MQPNRRVTFLLPNLGGGGAERVVVQIANNFSQLGIAVDLLLLQKNGVLLAEVSPRVNIVDMQCKNMYASLPKLIAYLKKIQPDVLMTALEFTSLAALLAKKISGVKTRMVVRVSVAVSQHKRSRFKKIIEQQMISLMYPWADKIVSVSHDTGKDLVQFANLSAEKIQTIYNPVISQEMLTLADADVHHKYFDDGQPPVILGAGRLTEQKDFTTLIRAFKIVHENIPARLIILGEGSARASLESLIESLGLSEDISLPGYEINPFAYMKKSSVFVLSSRWEGLPNALIQALACGCPAVSTNCPTGPAEILDHGKYGHLVPVGDEEALARAIIQSLQGDRRKPPADWLDQFRVEPVIRQYLNIMGLDFGD